MPTPGVDEPAHTTPACMTLERLEAEITTLAGHLAAAECRWLELVAEFDRREGWKPWGCRCAAHWLGWHCGLDGRAAREKVRAITRVATAADEEAFVTWALHGTASQVERIVRAHRRASAAGDETAAAEQRHRARYLTWDWDDDGSLVVHARLTPEDGALLIEALEKTKDAEGGSAEPPAGARNCDALVAMANHVLASDPPGGSTGDRYQVVVHTDLDALAHDRGDLCELDDGPALAPETVHHRLVHEGGYTLRLDEALEVVVTAPNGVRLEMLDTTIDPDDGTLEARNRAGGIVIDADTSVARWSGEALDLDLALTHLVSVDGRAN